MNPNIIIKNPDKHKIVTGSQAQAERLVYSCVEVLFKHYPDHPWHVVMSKDMSVIGIRHLEIDSNYGMILHTLEVQSDPELKCVVRKAGELLERAHLDRGKRTKAPVEFDITDAQNKPHSDKKTIHKKVFIR